ncbi:class F sortase [Micromonospora sp. WMMD1128]|uniref:class F sortase n=1 Tax=Micromonospora sp. WMMD1128 TaxID=3015150 RepID=UPI00248B8782|nr:class F sortase [Micromonospora sp. WMMD1128]WBB76672.1 class F sortase [Micromonospora sp. WMMD1128]
MDNPENRTATGPRRQRTALAAGAALLAVAAAVAVGLTVSGGNDRPPRVTVPAATSPAPAPPPAGRSGVLTSGPLMASSPPVRIGIPSLGVDAPIVPLGLRPDGAMQVPDSATDVGWFTRAPTPGSLGPAVLAGHVNWKGREGSFFDLARLRPDTPLAVRRRDGSTATFVVTRVEQHPKDRFPSDDVYGPTDHAALRLITCGGEFDRKRDSYRDNVIVYARLARAQPA